MNTFLTKLAMLVLFLLAVSAGWAALSMTFPVNLYNLLLGILAAFFLFRALELVDKVNNLGPYADDDQENHDEKTDSDEETPEDEEAPDEE